MLGRNNANRRGLDWPPEASPVDSLFLVCGPFVLEADGRSVGPTLAGLETSAFPLASYLIELDGEKGLHGGGETEEDGRWFAGGNVFRRYRLSSVRISE